MVSIFIDGNNDDCMIFMHDALIATVQNTSNNELKVVHHSLICYHIFLSRKMDDSACNVVIKNVIFLQVIVGHRFISMNVCMDYNYRVYHY